jgi:hypothetical protein
MPPLDTTRHVAIRGIAALRLEGDRACGKRSAEVSNFLLNDNCQGHLVAQAP